MTPCPLLPNKLLSCRSDSSYHIVTQTHYILLVKQYSNKPISASDVIRLFRLPFVILSVSKFLRLFNRYTIYCLLKNNESDTFAQTFTIYF